jgi:hypothetical protein
MIRSLRTALLFSLFLSVESFFLCEASFGFSLRNAPATTTDFAPQANPAAFNHFLQGEDVRGPDYKSSTRAVLYSFLLPGLGQYYLGEKRAALSFFIAEGAIWTSFVVFQVQGHLRRDSYKDYAVVFSGISTRDHSDDFYREIGDYDSSDEYEELIKQEGRSATYPNSDYATIEEYFVTNRVSDFEPWMWRSTKDREHYYDLRWGSRLAFRRALYSVAAALGNRIVSSVYALRSSRILDRTGMLDKPQLKLGFDSYTGSLDQVRFGITLTRDF